MNMITHAQFTKTIEDSSEKSREILEKEFNRLVSQFNDVVAAKTKKLCEGLETNKEYEFFLRINDFSSQSVAFEMRRRFIFLLDESGWDFITDPRYEESEIPSTTERGKSKKETRLTGWTYRFSGKSK